MTCCGRGRPALGGSILIHGPDVHDLGNALRKTMKEKQPVTLMSTLSEYFPGAKGSPNSVALDTNLKKAIAMGLNAAKLATQGVVNILTFPDDILQGQLFHAAQAMEGSSVTTLLVYTPINNFRKGSSQEMGKELINLGLNYTGSTKKTPQSLYYLSRNDVDAAIDHATSGFQEDTKRNAEMFLLALLHPVMSASDGVWVEPIRKFDVSLNSVGVLKGAQRVIDIALKAFAESKKSEFHEGVNPLHGQFPPAHPREWLKDAAEVVAKNWDRVVEGLNGSNLYYAERKMAWNKPEILYSVETDDLPQYFRNWEVEKALREYADLAFHSWGEVSPLKFIRSPSRDVCDIDLNFRHMTASGAVAGATWHTYAPRHQAHIRMEIVDISNVAFGDSLLHEIGHSLGLLHSSIRGSLMFPCANQRGDGKLDSDAVCAITELYGPQGSCPVSPLVNGQCGCAYLKDPYPRPNAAC